jgi:GTPase SAR1 family protein
MFGVLGTIIGNITGFSSNESTSKYINICLVGCVSAGKSTILNAFFSRDYAQCKIKRTTMMPNKFVESTNGNPINSFEEISSTISKTNAQIYTQTEKQNNFKLEDYGNELTFYIESMEMNMDSQIKICIYDIPGLNDARTKRVYYNYLEKNFHKFNIVLFVIDIQSGLNTSDEMDILKFLSANILKHKNESGKNIGLLGIVNKADDMQLNGNKLEVLGELGEMFDQSYRTIEQEFTNNKIQTNLLGCIPICGLDSNLYRMIKKYQDISKLSDENILRIGVNEEGSKFRRLSSIEQRRKVQEKILDQDFVNDMIILSGFSQIEQALQMYIKSNGLTMVMENLTWEYSRLPTMTEANMMENIKKRIEVLNNLFEFSEEKYSELMIQVIKQTNTIVYKKICQISNPIQVKQYYDLNVLEPIISDPILKSQLIKFFNPTVYPNYLTDRILELVVSEYQEQPISFAKLKYIELFESIGKLNGEIADIILQSIISNPRGTSTFVFDGVFDLDNGFDKKTKNNNYLIPPQLSTPNIKPNNFDIYCKIIKQIDKLKNSSKFIGFIRFLLANIYSNQNLTEPSYLVEKIILFNRYGELPMKQFINDLRIEKKQIDTNKHIGSYLQGLEINDSSSHILELYYICKCREFTDNENFLSHEKIIPVNLSSYI